MKTNPPTPIQKLQARMKDEIEIRDVIQKELDKTILVIPVLREQIAQTNRDVLFNPSYRNTNKYVSLVQKYRYRTEDIKFHRTDIEASNVAIKKIAMKIYNLEHGI